MVVGVATARLFIRASRSLKEKRRVLQSLKEQLRKRFNISVAEVGAQDSHQVAELGLATVSWSRGAVEKTLEAVRGFLERQPNAALSALQWECL